MFDLPFFPVLITFQVDKPDKTITLNLLLTYSVHPLTQGVVKMVDKVVKQYKTLITITISSPL